MYSSFFEPFKTVTILSQTSGNIQNKAQNLEKNRGKEYGGSFGLGSKSLGLILVLVADTETKFWSYTISSSIEKGQKHDEKSGENSTKVYVFTLLDFRVILFRPLMYSYLSIKRACTLNYFYVKENPPKSTLNVSLYIH